MTVGGSTRSLIVRNGLAVSTTSARYGWGMLEHSCGGTLDVGKGVQRAGRIAAIAAVGSNATQLRQ